MTDQAATRLARLFVVAASTLSAALGLAGFVMRRKWIFARRNPGARLLVHRPT